MNNLAGKRVLISGAGSEIGRACAEAFAARGARLAICAGDMEALQEIAEELVTCYQVEVVAYELDVRDRNMINQMVETLPPAWRDLDVLVNNAELALGREKVYQGDAEDWDTMIDSNIKGLLYMTRAVLPGMIERKGGHIINVESEAGALSYPGGAVYSASQAAVRRLSEAMRMELRHQPVRVTNIRAELTLDHYSMNGLGGEWEREDSPSQEIYALTGKDVAEVVVYCASLPPHLQIAEVWIAPTRLADSEMMFPEIDSV